MPTLYLKDTETASPLAIQLGNNIRNRCMKLHLKQSELGERSGVAPSHISLMLHGRANPTLATLERLAEALGISVVEMLGPAPILPNGDGKG